KVLAHGLAIDRAEVSDRATIGFHVRHEPGEAGDVLRAGAGLGENGQDIAEGLADLGGEALGESFLLIPADDAAGDQDGAAAHHAVGIAARALPAWWLQDGQRPIGRGMRWCLHRSPPASASAAARWRRAKR